MQARIVSLAAAIVAAALALPGVAQAAVTTSSLDAPADQSSFTYDQQGSAQPDVTFSGHSDGTTGDQVRLVCDDGANGLHGFGATTDVASDGTFSTSVSRSHLPGGNCVVRAIPTGMQPTDLSPFSGPRISVSRFRSFSTVPASMPANPNTGHVTDFYTWEQGTLAGNDYYAATGCGLCDSKLFYAASWTSSRYLWFSNAAVYEDENMTPDRSYLQVDGRDAIGPGAEYFHFADNTAASQQTGYPQLTFSYTDGPGPGELTIDETDPFVRCAGSPTSWPPASKSDCPSWVSTGIELDRQTVQSADGRTVSIADTWRSVDAQAHVLDLDYDQYFDGSPNGPSFQFPWVSGAYATHSSGDVVSAPPSGPATIYVRGDSKAPDGSTLYPQGALTFSPAPTGERFYGGLNQGNRDFLLSYHLTVPAGGTTQVHQVFNLGTTRADVAGRAAAAEQSLPSWAPASSQQPVTAPVSPVTAPSTTPVSVRSRRIRFSGTTALERVACTAPAGSRCTGDVLETTTPKPLGGAHGAASHARSKTLGRARFSIPAGATRTVRVKLSKAGLAMLRHARHHRLAVLLELRLTDPANGRLTVASTSHATLRLPRHHH